MAKNTEEKSESWCGSCWGGDKGFPTFWVIVLVLAIVWFATEMGWMAIEFPWLSAILVIVAIGVIIDNYAKK